MTELNVIDWILAIGIGLPLGLGGLCAFVEIILWPATRYVLWPVAREVTRLALWAIVWALPE